MAPSRLEEKLRKLGLSTDDAGASRSAPVSKTKYMFRIYFPKPPYDGLQFNALKSGSGFNFTGQLLGVGGKQLQRIKQESSARVEVVNAQGNLNGAHPDPLDPDLHALISADSMSKLQKAAGMVWELLQPVNAKFLPIDIIPGGSVRLTVAQPGKAAVKAAAAAAQQAAAANTAKPVKTRNTPATPGGQEAASEEAAAAPSRPASVSPSLTPVTPAATAGRASAAFAANRNTSMQATPNSCSSRSCNSPVLTGPGSTSSSSSSNMGGLFGTLEGFSLPPAAVQPAASSPSEPEAVTPTAAAKLDAAAATAQANYGAAAAPAASSPEQQQLQPPTPCIEQGQSGETVRGGQQSRRADGSLAGSSCVSLPSALMQDLDIAADETVPRTAQNSSAGTPAAAAAAAATNPSDASGATPAAADVTSGPLPTVQKPQQQKQAGSSPVLGPEPSGGSCSSCFQYGLGLCTSSSWDSSVSCSSKESPALQALLVDHQRQQQQHAEHMQLMQLQQHAVGSLGSQGTMRPFGTPGSGLLAPLVGSFEGESLHLGPGALLQPSVLSRGPSTALEGMLHHRSDAMLVPPTPAAGFPGAAGVADPACFGQHSGLHQQHQQQLQEQQRMLALAAAAGEGLGFGPRAPQGLGGFIGAHAAGPPGPAGGLHGSMGVGLGWAPGGAAEMPHTAAVFGTPPAAFADMSMRPMGGGGGGGGGVMMQHQHNSKDAPVWMHHHQQEPQQQMMMRLMHGQQQGAAGPWQEQFGGSAGAGFGPRLEQPGALSIW